ncbi:MAG: hypothetical protein KBD94_07940 [Pyrinomonadaceae bacterium]|nr:hypothetical protein [Pyrinomonadaceae bacterium]
MIERWEVFQGRPNGVDRSAPRVTLGPKGIFLLNAVAVEALGSPEAVELMFDKGRGMVGFRAVDRGRQNAFPLVKKKGMAHWTLRAAPFCVHYGLKAERTMLFNEVELTRDGAIAFDIANSVRVTRGTR